MNDTFEGLDTEQRAPDESITRARRRLLVVGVAVVALGAAALWRTFSIRQPSGYTVIGPRVFPVVISSGLMLAGLALVIQAILGGNHWLEHKLATEAATSSPSTSAMLIALLVGYATTMEPVGYVPTTALFLPLAARVLGSRRPLRDSSVAVVMSLVIFLSFTRLLNIHLPPGILGELI